MAESVYCKKCFKRCSGMTELELHVMESHRKKTRTGKRSNKSKNNHSDDYQPHIKSTKTDGQFESSNDCWPQTKSFETDDQFESLNERQPKTKSLKTDNQYESSNESQPHSNSFEPDNEFESLNECRLERKYVECNVCQEICADESALKNHCLEHVYDNHEKCGICSKTFKNALDLQNHFKEFHSHCASFTCENCKEQYSTKKAFSKHNCSKRYPCNVCGEIFKSKDELLRHFFIHKSLQGSYLHFTTDS